jgi:hypothetical protein
MGKTFIALSIILGLTGYFGFTSTTSAENGIKENDFVYVCKAGKDCGRFESAATDVKDCKCGAESEKLHVLKVAGEVAVLCQCGGGCSCDLHASNPYLCGCGTPVKVVRIIK